MKRLILFLIIIILLSGCGVTKASSQTSTVPLDVRQEALWGNPALSGIESQIADLERRVSKLESSLAKLEGDVSGGIYPFTQFKGGSLEERIARIEQQLGIGTTRLWKP